MRNEPVGTHAWLRSLREGDVESLARLFSHYRPRLRRLLHLRMDPSISARVDPSDVLQDVYLDARQQLNAYLRDRKVVFYVWLRALTWQRMLKVQRRHLIAQRRTVGREVTLPADSTFRLPKKLIAQQSTPSNNLMRMELQRHVQAAMNQLKEEDREVIVMRDFEGMSNTEVAQTLGITDSGATRRYGRALHRLKLALDSM